MADQLSPARSATAFFAVTFFISWGFWVPVALDRFGLLPVDLPEVLVPLAGFGTVGPALAAILVSWRNEGGAGVRRLLAQYGRWWVGWRWYAAAVPVYPALALLAAFLFNAFGGQPPLVPEATSGSAWLVLGLILCLTVFGEETGWRGYALPALQTRHTALAASMILGTVWTLWHVPFWTLQSSFIQYGWVYMLLNWVWILAASTYITWLMNNTGNSVLLAWLFHLSLNLVNVGYMLVTSTVGAYVILIALSWAVALALLAVHGPRRLRHGTNGP